MDSQEDAKNSPDEVLEQISGGTGGAPDPNKVLPPCPNYGTDRYETILSNWYSEDHAHLYFDLLCNKCRHEWVVRYY